MSEDDKKIIGVIHFPKTSSDDVTCYTFAADKNDYTKNINFNEEYKIAEGNFSDLEVGSVFRNKKNLLQVNKYFENLRKSYFLCRGCTALKKFNSSLETPYGFDDDDYSSITGTFPKCEVFNLTFGYMDNFTKVSLDLSNCVQAQGNFQYCKGLEEVKINYSRCAVLNGEFVGCVKLKSVEFENDLPKLVYGKSSFEGCTSLTSCEVPLPSLLTGVNMFKGCKLDEESFLSIIGSLPKLTMDNGVKFNDYSLSDIEVNEKLDKLFSDWGDQYSISEKPDANSIIGSLVRNKSKSQFTFKKKDIRFDYTLKEYIYYWSSQTISFEELGVLDVDVSSETEMKINSRELTSEIDETIRKAIAKGWKIRVNGKELKINN